MAKKEEINLIPEEELAFLSQLVKSLEDSLTRLEEYYENNEPDKFNNLKKMMISISKKLSDGIK